VITRQAQRAGIAFHVKNYPRSQLVQDVIPHGNFAVAIFAETATPDPSVTSTFACDRIPAVANQFSGQNYSHWCNQQATALMQQSDAEVDIDRRVSLIHGIGKAIRDDLVWLPFYQLPVVAAWRTDKVAGPTGDFALSGYTIYWTINKWHLP